MTSINDEREIPYAQAPIDEPADHRPSHNLRFYALLWGRIFVKSLLSCLPSIILLWVYCLPSMIMGDEMSESTFDLLYIKVRKLITSSSFFAFNGTYLVLLYHMELCMRAIKFCFVPGFFLDLFLDLALDMDLIAMICNSVLILLALVFIHRERIALNPNQLQFDCYQRKAATVVHLAKMALVIHLIFVIVTSIVPVFAEAGFYGKLILRFIVLPCLTAGCSSLQMHLLSSTPPIHIEYLVPAVWISNGCLKIFERLFTNSIFNSGDYLNFMMSTFFASLVEMFSHATYFARTQFLRKVFSRFSRSANATRKQVVATSVIPPQEIDAVSPSIQTSSVSRFVEMRRIMIIQDITIEIAMVFTVTSILYFVDRFEAETSFETIPNFQTFVIQLLIQLVFELFSDVFGLYWTISKHGLSIQMQDVELQGKWFWLWVLFLTFQTFYLLQHFIEDQNY